MRQLSPSPTVQIRFAKTREGPSKIGKGLLDTGCQHNIMGRKQAMDLELDIRQCDDNAITNVLDANGGTAQLNEYTTVFMRDQHDEKIICDTFYISDSLPDECLIGWNMTYMRLHSYVAPKSNMWYIPKTCKRGARWVPEEFQEPTIMITPMPLHLKKDICVMPGKHTHLEVDGDDLDKNSQRMFGIVEPVAKM
jgi:hypothetical protein